MPENTFTAAFQYSRWRSPQRDGWMARFGRFTGVSVRGVLGAKPARPGRTRAPAGQAVARAEPERSVAFVREAHIKKAPKFPHMPNSQDTACCTRSILCEIESVAWAGFS